MAARLSLVKLYANMGYLYAKTAIEKKSGTPLTQPGGAFARIEQAAATLKAYGDAKGPGDASFQKMQAYVTDIKRQVDEAGAHLNSTGVAVAPTSTSAVDKATENYFKKWWELLDVAQKAVAAGEGSQAVAAAVRHHDNWKGWLSKHSAYAQAPFCFSSVASAFFASPSFWYTPECRPKKLPFFSSKPFCDIARAALMLASMPSASMCATSSC